MSFRSRTSKATDGFFEIFSGCQGLVRVGRTRGHQGRFRPRRTRPPFSDEIRPHPPPADRRGKAGGGASIPGPLHRARTPLVCPRISEGVFRLPLAPPPQKKKTALPKPPSYSDCHLCPRISDILLSVFNLGRWTIFHESRTVSVRQSRTIVVDLGRRTSSASRPASSSASFFPHGI